MFTLFIHTARIMSYFCSKARKSWEPKTTITYRETRKKGLFRIKNIRKTVMCTILCNSTPVGARVIRKKTGESFYLLLPFTVASHFPSECKAGAVTRVNLEKNSISRQSHFVFVLVLPHFPGWGENSFSKNQHACSCFSMKQISVTEEKNCLR